MLRFGIAAKRIGARRIVG